MHVAHHADDDGPRSILVAAQPDVPADRILAMKLAARGGLTDEGHRLRRSPVQRGQPAATHDTNPHDVKVVDRDQIPVEARRVRGVRDPVFADVDLRDRRMAQGQRAGVARFLHAGDRSHALDHCVKVIMPLTRLYHRGLDAKV